MLVADRFIVRGASGIDLASGEPVRLRVAAPSGRAPQFMWSQMCGVHARLRHPCLNPLVDYGALDGHRVFEAYAAHPAPSSRSALRHVSHAVRFLHAHGVALSADAAALALRNAPGASLRRGRALGIVLQDRAVLASIADVLDACAPAGPCLITVSGAASCGLRTVRALTARAARLRGYVPVSPAALAGNPFVIDALAARHVCVLADEGLARAERAALAELLARLGRAGARRHVVITFARAASAGWNVLPIDPMGVKAMTSMVFTDLNGPTPAELFDAARSAGGKPGAFLESLKAAACEPRACGASIAHEAAHPYVVTPDAVSSAATGKTPWGRDVLARAPARAEALLTRGRHAAAVRLLARASRVLAARGEMSGAAACAQRLGLVHLERGAVTAALDRFELARSIAPDPIRARDAALGIATAWVDDGRLGEAEALLRSVAVSAALEKRPDAAVACALARCLYWQGRYPEAAVILDPHAAGSPDPLCLAMAARVHLAERAVAPALRLARRAAEDLAGGSDRTRTTVHRVLAAALSAAGDAAAARQEVRLAIDTCRRARLPLASLHARVALLTILLDADEHTAARRVAVRLSALKARATLPRLLRYQLHKASARALGTAPDAFVRALEAVGVRWPGPDGHTHEGRPTPATQVEAMLEVWHSAPDEHEALDRICAAALQQLRAASVVIVAGSDRRQIGRSGRPWPAESSVVNRVLTSGFAAGLHEDGVGEARLEAAEPIRFAGEALGTVACRWAAGTAISAERAGATLKAAALAAAGPVRTVLDRAAPEAPDPAWTDLLGASAGAVAMREATARAARAPFPVLIEGESGSGKELVARAIHRLSARRDRRLCAVNCAALTDDLLEAELFGHTRGAFTGAVGERAGLFEEADGGTLFLDEVGELSSRAQAKLLRVIQEGEIRRVGESFARKVDVRIVAATNRRLELEASAGRFRSDLRFRLDVVRIVVPPLRERAADIPMLALHFWSDAAARVGSRATLSPEAIAALARYDWPGNVRELQNVIAWIAVHSPRRGRIGAAALPSGVAGALTNGAATFEAAREEFERRFIRSALARANGHRASAAASLGITRQGLAKMIRRLRIDDRPVA